MFALAVPWRIAFAQNIVGSSPAAAVCRPGATPMARVELYFGGHHKDAAAWRRFVAEVVTPRFPAGLTHFEGVGQWRGPRGLTREPAHILVIFYKSDDASDARIEEIRALYKSRFRQASVLRADSAACVGF